MRVTCIIRKVILVRKMQHGNFKIVEERETPLILGEIAIAEDETNRLWLRLQLVYLHV